MGKHDARRPLKFNCLRETVDEARDLQQRGYTQVGNWDLGKACQHLTKTMRMSIEGAPFRLPFFLRPIARRILFGKVMSGKPTRLPLKTAPQFRPVDAFDVTQEIDEYVELVQKVMADDAPLLPDHPVFGPISKSEWRTFHAWHAAHHFSFLIPNEPGFSTKAVAI